MSRYGWSCLAEKSAHLFRGTGKTLLVWKKGRAASSFSSSAICARRLRCTKLPSVGHTGAVFGGEAAAETWRVGMDGADERVATNGAGEALR